MPSLPPSLEALEQVAERRLGQEASAVRDALNGNVAVDLPRVRPGDFAKASTAVLALDPHRATLLGEAALVTAMRGPNEAFARARAKVTLRLQTHGPATPFDAVPGLLMADEIASRREALVRLAEAEVPGLRADARLAVEALRDAVDALDDAVVARLGFGAFEASAVLAETDDLLRELDADVFRAQGIDPQRVSWADRLRSLSAPSVSRSLPPAVWAETGLRWAARVGLDASLRGVVDGLVGGRSQPDGVASLTLRAGERALLLGRPGIAGWYAGEVMGSAAESVARTLGRGHSPGHVRGLDRATYAVVHALGRRLLLDRGWLTREVGVEGSSRERMLLEAMHAEVLRVRRDAVLASFGYAVVSRAGELPTRFVELMARAWRVAPSPAWAAVVAGRATETGSFWGDRWALRARGAGFEAAAVAWLRDRYDEDWWRNPSAGEGLSTMVVGLNALGPEAWFETLPKASEAGRYADVLRAITRG